MLSPSIVLTKLASVVTSVVSSSSSVSTLSEEVNSIIKTSAFSILDLNFEFMCFDFVLFSMRLFRNLIGIQFSLVLNVFGEIPL